MRLRLSTLSPPFQQACARELLSVLEEPPTLGNLMQLCEENYGMLRRLVPTLGALRGNFRSVCAEGLDLHLEIIEQSPHTTLLRLTHLFPAGPAHRLPRAEPDALLRAYQDAKQVEILDLYQTILPLHPHHHTPALAAKWKANRFLSKWLAYCLALGHRFPIPFP